MRMSAVAVCVSVGVLAIKAQTISGKVTDAISGKPIEGAKVTVVELQKSYTVGPDGVFATDTIAKGTYSVRAEAPNYLTQSRTVVLAARTEVGAAHVSVDFVLYNISTNADAVKGSLSVKYFFPGHNVVEISISDSTGKVIRKVFDRSRKSGTREFAWDGRNNDGQSVAAGTYNCKLVSGNLVTMRKFVWKGEEKRGVQ